jgi:hypothetical protein
MCVACNFAVISYITDAMRGPAKELTACYDCSGAISFSAAACPHCGSTEPTGPYFHSKRERQRHRIEARNDHSLAIATLVCTAVGILYGATSGGGWLWAGLAALGYGTVGLLAGVPVGFLFNVGRALMRG